MTFQDQPDENATTASEKPLHIGKPTWLKTEIPKGEVFFKIKKDLREKKLYTVCEEAKCPNISECWSTNTATFMILGDTCTRGCRFCHIKTGDPQGWLDPKEADNTAESIRVMNLKYAVITMVDRDDLPDGGAAHVDGVFAKIREVSPHTKLEFLGGDFRAMDASLVRVLAHQPEVFAHNIETVERLTPRVRDRRATYRQSLEVLRRVKELAHYPVLTKSAIMLGLGEEIEEVVQALTDLRSYGVDYVTMGQYMRPTKKHLSIKSFVPPEVFEQLKEKALALGFLSVASGPLVRSSYRAHDFYQQAVSRKAELDGKL